MNYNLIFLLIFLTISSLKGQNNYRGLERMCWKNPKGKVECFDHPRKWYHENTISIEKDSIFIYKTPIHIKNGKKHYSASDGGFYYYYGVINNIDNNKVAFLTSYNCSYCNSKVRKDTITGFQYPIPHFDTLKVKNINNNKIQIGKVIYTKLKLSETDLFPSKSLFYLDSNSISRKNPKGQYELISQAIKDFTKTKELSSENDTIRINLDRFADLEEKQLIETLDQSLITFDNGNSKVKYYSNSQLKELEKSLPKPIRVIKITEIIDNWQSARISLTNKIIVPNNIKNFREKEYSNLFHYKKIGKNYILEGDLPENNWETIEKK